MPRKTIQTPAARLGVGDETLTTQIFGSYRRAEGIDEQLAHHDATHMVLRIMEVAVKEGVHHLEQLLHELAQDRKHLQQDLAAALAMLSADQRRAHRSAARQRRKAALAR